MAETLEPTERLPDTTHSRRVNPADRSNPEKKDNGFSNALKEKMKEKLKDKAHRDDDVILDIDVDEPSATDEEEMQATEEPVGEPESDDSEEQSTNHVDVKA